MRYYTGCYPITHGATWNRVPVPVGEVTLGEMLQGVGRRLALAGKTHVMPDHAGLARLHLGGGSALGAAPSVCAPSAGATDEPEQLFDFAVDPQEMHHLARDASGAAVRDELRACLLDFLARRKHRATVTETSVAQVTAAHKKAGCSSGSGSRTTKCLNDMPLGTPNEGIFHPRYAPQPCIWVTE
jgi:arylsulfatase A-like enzyme